MTAPDENALNEVVSNAAFVFARSATADIAERTLTWFEHDHAAQAAQLSKSWANSTIEQRAGRVFELLETASFNAAAARAGADVYAATTESMGQPRAAADIVIQGPDVFKEVQAKVYAKATGAASALRSDRYAGMGRLVPRDQASGVHDVLAKRLRMNPGGIYVSGYEDVAENLTGELRHGEVRSGGVTREELWEASESPEATDAAVRRIGEELSADARQRMVVKSAGVAAVVGGGIAGLIATVRIVRDDEDDRPVAQQVADVAGEIATSGLRSGAVAGIGTYLSMAAADGAVGTLLGQTTAPLAIATTIVAVAEHGLAHVTGDISLHQMVEQTAAACVRSSAGWAYGVVGQTLIPIPVVGGLVGHLVGHVSAYCVMEGLKVARVLAEEADAAEERLAWLEVEAVHAVKRLEEDRLRLDALLEDEAKEFRTVLLPLLDDFESALRSGNDSSAMESLVSLNRQLGVTLEWHSRPEFDAWMEDRETVFEL